MDRTEDYLGPTRTRTDTQETNPFDVVLGTYESIRALREEVDLIETEQLAPSSRPGTICGVVYESYPDVQAAMRRKEDLESQGKKVLYVW